MNSGQDYLLRKMNERIILLENKINNENIDINQEDLNYEVKHILHDMQSVLDYIAVDLLENYFDDKKYHKLYFPYAKDSVTEEDFQKSIDEKFPNLQKEDSKLYNEILNLQPFKAGSNWIEEMNKLNNEVKHNGLYIVRVEKTRNVLFSSNDTSMLVKGNTTFGKYDDGLGFNGPGEIYFNGPGRAAIYSNGVMQVGEGTYNLNDNTSNNLKVEKYYEIKIKSDKYEEDIISLLKEIHDEEEKFYNKLLSMNY